MAQEKKSNPIIGNGKTSKKIFASVCLTDLDEKLILNHANGKKYVRIEIIELKEVGKYGDNVLISQHDANK